MMIRKDHLKMVAKMAWSFHNTTGEEFNELYAQGCLEYCESVIAYDKTVNCKLSTYAYGRIRNQLINFIKRQQMIKGKHITIPEHLDFWEWCRYEEPAEYAGDFPIMLSTAPPDVQVIAKMVMNDPRYSAMKPKLARGAIREDLRAMGWKWENIWAAIRHAKEFFNENRLDCII